MIAKKHRAARVIEPRSAEDIELMRTVLKMKVEQNLSNCDFCRKWEALVQIGDVLIVEDSSRRQNASGLFWGAALVDVQADVWRGYNTLGRLWMELTSHYREGGSSYGA